MHRPFTRMQIYLAVSSIFFGILLCTVHNVFKLSLYEPLSSLISSTAWGGVLISLGIGRIIAVKINSKGLKLLTAALMLVLLWMPALSSFWVFFITDLMVGKGGVLPGIILAPLVVALEVEIIICAVFAKD